MAKFVLLKGTPSTNLTSHPLTFELNLSKAKLQIVVTHMKIEKALLIIMSLSLIPTQPFVDMIITSQTM